MVNFIQSTNMEIAKAKVANALTSAASDHVIAVAADVYDENKEKYQSTLNQEFDTRLGNIESGTSGGGGELTENSVDTKHIKNGAVTEDKLSNEVKNKLNQTGGGGTFSGSAEDVTYEGSLEASNVQEAIDKLNEEKVDREDNAPKLTAGFANNLVGRGEATEEVIGFRPSGGDTSIEDGTARIERLKGNTVVWNQTYPTGWTTKHQGVTSVSTNGLITLNGTTTGTYLNIKNGKGYSDIPTNHTGLYVLKVIKDDKKYLQGKKIGLLNKGVSTAIDNNFASFFHTNKDTNAWSLGLILIATGDVITDIQFRVSIYDLTKMFGEGYEPTTIEEFNARKPIGIDEYAYNEGELISTNVEQIKSVGFNAYNGEYAKVLGGKQYELVGTYSSIGFSEEIGGELTNIEMPSDKLYTPEMDGYIYAQGVDICIHLVHTGYRNGEYEPYKEFRRDIPIKSIKDSEGNQLFPNGLLSAGNVYDEITATKAIKRIGVVDMGSLGWYRQSGTDSTSQSIYVFSVYLDGVKKPSYGKFANAINSVYTIVASKAINDTVFNNKTYMIYTDGTIYLRDDDYTSGVSFQSAMSGVMLYYELAEPIEVDLEEPINLDYEVSDFGTEEAISTEATTPLKADIIYQFNAVDRIRDNSRHTEEANALLDAKADKNKQLKLSVKDNGNIVLSNDSGESKEFMPATPSGDPLHESYLQLGATYNDTGSDIIKTGLFGQEVVHKAGRYYLNDVGDLTNDDMKYIYANVYAVYFLNKPRMFQSNTKLRAFIGVSEHAGQQLSLSVVYVFYRSSIVSAYWSKPKSFVLEPNVDRHLQIENQHSTYTLFGNATNLKYVQNLLCNKATTNISIFKKCSSLEEARMAWIKANLLFSDSPNISKASILYAIEYAQPTSAISITLHANAYDRLVEDTDIVSALEAKNASLQGTGGSISLVSA